MSETKDMLLTETQLGKLAGFDSGWPIRNFRLTGGLPFIRVGKRIFYRWSTYQKWLAEKEAVSVRKPDAEYGKLRQIN